MAIFVVETMEALGGSAGGEGASGAVSDEAGEGD